MRVPTDAPGIDELRSRLADAEETLRAIRRGEVDALVIGTVPGEERLFTLTSVDQTYRSFVEEMTDGAATVSPTGIVLYANQALADLISSTRERIVGRSVLDLVAPPSRELLRRMIGPAAARGSIEVAVLTADDREVPALVGTSRLPVEGHRITCLTVTDLTSERKAEAALAHLVQHDVLTGLPNRSLLTERLAVAAARRTTGTGLLALFFCDVDDFKNVNDAFGHQGGDAVLRTIARRLEGAVRPEDTVARIGGDEFVVLCDDLVDLDAAASVAERLSAAVANPVVAGTGLAEVTMSVGVAVATDTEEAGADRLLRDADEAMYKAKREGLGAVRFFDDALRTVAATRLQVLSDLRRATATGQMRLVYQPVVDLAAGTVVGVEALMRWQHPTRGQVGPDEFIPFAERSGLVVQMGAWAMREACHQGARWQRTVSSEVAPTMAVNVSGRQLTAAAGLVETVTHALRESGLDPAALVLEVTESALMVDAEAALRVVEQLKHLGVQIAIDDFGTGYSSLVYLKRFPVDLLKIDRSFVAGLGRDPEDSAIARSVIDLAQAFGIAAVAEGIETPDQLAELRRLGCRYGQGYLWSPGRPAAELGPDLRGPDLNRWP